MVGGVKALILLLAVVLVGGCASTPKVVPNSPEAKAAIEKEIRRQCDKPTGELTKADLERVTVLDLYDKQLTDVTGLEKLTQLETLWLYDNQLTSVKGLEKLTQLKGLDLLYNPDLTTAQIGELKKALPKCFIESNPTK